MKKLIKGMLLLIPALCLGFIIIFYKSSSKIEGIESIKCEQLETLPMNQTYDYEEILKDMEINGLDTKERIANFKAQHDTNTKLISSSLSGTVRYTKLAMDSYTFTHNFKKYELTPNFYIGLFYTSELGPDKMISIAEPYIKTSNGAKCVFNGSIFYRLENGHSFYYGVSGDLYKTNTSKSFIKNIDFDGRYYSSSLKVK